MAFIPGGFGDNNRPTNWDTFHISKYVIASNENDQSFSSGGNGFDASTAQFNLGEKYENLRSLELLQGEVPNIFPAVEGSGLTVNGTSITFRSGTPSNGTTWAAELQSVLIAQSHPDWLVTFDTFTRRLVFNNATLSPAGVQFNFENNVSGAKLAKAMGFIGPRYTGRGFTGAVTRNLPPGFTNYESELLPDISGPNVLYIQVAGFLSQQTSSNGSGFTFSVPINVPFGGLITFSQQTNFRQSLQYYWKGQTIDFTQIRIQIYDNYNQLYPILGNIWTLWLGLTTWDQLSTVGI